MVQIKRLLLIDLGTYTYNQNLDKFDWKLQEEQKEILGYTVKKQQLSLVELCGMVYTN
jgi:GLPGLI family protein